MMLSDWAIAILFVGLVAAVVSDLFSHRVPNSLTFSMMLVALVLHIWFGHWEGLAFTFFGLVAGLLCFLPFHLLGTMGAGDVKLLAAVGAIVGPGTVVITALMTILAGGLIALVYITARGGLLVMLRRYSSMLALLAARQPQYIPPAPGEAAGLRFSYALAIACGTVLAII